MLKMQVLEDEDDLAYAETEKKARVDSTSDGRPAWMRTLHTTASNWLHLIPQTLSHLKRTVDNIKVAGLPQCPWALDDLSNMDGRVSCAESQRRGSPEPRQGADPHQSDPKRPTRLSFFHGLAQWLSRPCRVIGDAGGRLPARPGPRPGSGATVGTWMGWDPWGSRRSGDSDWLQQGLF